MAKTALFKTEEEAFTAIENSVKCISEIIDDVKSKPTKVKKRLLRVTSLRLSKEFKAYRSLSEK